ncbi:MAG: peptidoglycan bridge formation glycyltransferase FemA/FemB family protein [Spirochaetia bacterium]|nr:peptidoglycan bridge formation glycyltransferase FemA/FemB family protein [Spirochaetia bacterium]
MTAARIPLQGLSSLDDPFQSSYWAAVKQHNGWEAFAVAADDQQLLVLKRPVLCRAALCYIPYGPQLPVPSDRRFAYLRDLSGEITRMTGPGVFLLRYDVPWQPPAEVPDLPQGVVRSPYAVQPEGTVRISLSGGLDAIYTQMRTRAKRQITRATDTILITCWDHSREQFDLWYETYRLTALRDHFIPRSAGYLHHLLLTGADPMVHGVESVLYLAWDQGRIIGGNIVLFTRDRALYLFGSSLRTESKRSCSYALQWHTIRQAVTRGCMSYDLYGIGPDDPNHHLHSLTLFKTGFGGQKIYREGCFDVIINPLIYHPYRAAEQLRMHRSRHRDRT